MIFLKKTKYRFLNCKGFSLAELMVSVGVSVIVSGIATFAFLMAFDIYLRMIRQYEAQAEMSSLMMNLRSSFSTGTYLTYGGVASVVNNATTNRIYTDGDTASGKIFSISDVHVPGGGSNYTGEPFLVAMFAREMGVQVGLSSGSLVGMQIVYQRPSIAARTSGAIYVDTEYATVLPGGWVRLSPVNAPQMFTRLVDFDVNNIKVRDVDGSMVNVTSAGGTPCSGASNCIGRPVLSAEVKAVMRYFTRGSEANWRWCNGSRMSLFAGCSMNSVNFYDVERKLNVVFANNPLEKGEYLPKAPFGNIHFFSPWFPLKRGP